MTNDLKKDRKKKYSPTIFVIIFIYLIIFNVLFIFGHINSWRYQYYIPFRHKEALKCAATDYVKHHYSEEFQCTGSSLPPDYIIKPFASRPKPMLYCIFQDNQNNRLDVHVEYCDPSSFEYFAFTITGNEGETVHDYVYVNGLYDIL